MPMTMFDETNKCAEQFLQNNYMKNLHLKDGKIQQL